MFVIRIALAGRFFSFLYVPSKWGRLIKVWRDEISIDKNLASKFFFKTFYLFHFTFKSKNGRFICLSQNIFQCSSTFLYNCHMYIKCDLNILPEMFYMVPLYAGFRVIWSNKRHSWINFTVGTCLYLFIVFVDRKTSDNSPHGPRFNIGPIYQHRLIWNISYIIIIITHFLGSQHLNL